ncbi:MAG: UDP-N-acetylmuramate--L-alanine ligase [Reichenbachiella sp.]
MKLENVHSVYFLGIGGIGMSAIARWFHANSYDVSGYDKTSTVLSQKLESEGISIHYQDDLNLITDQVKNNKDTSLIVYTPAVPKDLKELVYFQENGFEIYKRSQVLGMLTKSKFTIAVAGTHGKTTTSSMVAHLLKSAGVDCSAFIGGIMTNYDSNLLIGKNNDVMVVEADEFDRSFLTLHPDVAIITSTDADHLDIYGHKDALKESFNEFIRNIKKNGKLFIEEKIATDLNTSSKDLQVTSYGLNQGDIHSDNLTIEDGVFNFDYQTNEHTIAELKLMMPGFHNVSNAIAAIASIRPLVKNDQAILDGLTNYTGVKRRFEYIIKSEDVVLIDDYAHHPAAISALLNSARAMYPNDELTIVFQPHLYTRTRDFAEGFSESLSLADHVIMLDIYPARELPIEGVNAELIAKNIQAKSVTICQKENVVTYFDTHVPRVVLTVGAGDIDTLVLPIKEKLLNR